MIEPDAPKLLRRHRKERGLSLRAAGAEIVVDGKPVDGATWLGWEKGVLPKPAWMFEIERITGVQPSQFYSRPDASGSAIAPLQALLI